MPTGLPGYAELHCRSNFSFLSAASHPEELMRRARELGYAALALTDVCSLAGAVRAHVAAKSCGLPSIVGSEMRLEGGPRLVLLAQHREGYGNLSCLITRARRRSPKGEYRLAWEDLAQLGGGCLALWLPDADSAPAEGRRLAACLPGRLWIGAELHRAGGDRARLARLRAWGETCALPVAAGGVLMHVPERKPLPDALIPVRRGTPVEDLGEALGRNRERYLRTREELARFYPPDLLAETPAIAAASPWTSRATSAGPG